MGVLVMFILPARVEQVEHPARFRPLDVIDLKRREFADASEYRCGIDSTFTLIGIAEIIDHA